MRILQFVQTLTDHADKTLRFELPSGELVPKHFHITEIGCVEKRFIDCGGTYRNATSCLMQAWTANDLDHRLTAGKLARIFELAGPVLQSDDLPVELEYGVDVAAQYTLADEVKIAGQEIQIGLIPKQTDCLAREQCGVDACGDAGCCN